MSAITKRVTFIAKEGCEDIMKDLLTAMVEPSKAEPGLVFYDIFQCKENSRKFYAIESWESDEALDGHKATEHYAIYKSSFEQYCDDKYTEHLDILG